MPWKYTGSYGSVWIFTLFSSKILYASNGLSWKTSYIVKFRNDPVGRIKVFFWVKETESRNLTFEFKKYGNVEIISARSLLQRISTTSLREKLCCKQSRPGLIVTHFVSRFLYFLHSIFGKAVICQNFEWKPGCNWTIPDSLQS